MLSKIEALSRSLDLVKRCARDDVADWRLNEFLRFAVDAAKDGVLAVAAELCDFVKAGSAIIVDDRIFFDLAHDFLCLADLGQFDLERINPYSFSVHPVSRLLISETCQMPSGLRRMWRALLDDPAIMLKLSRKFIRSERKTPKKLNNIRNKLITGGRRLFLSSWPPRFHRRLLSF